jgi:hypothetical protein
MVDIGVKGSALQKKAQKDATNEINIGMTVVQENAFLVGYVEIFHHESFCCLILEYCERGDLQTEVLSIVWRLV